MRTTTLFTSKLELLSDDESVGELKKTTNCNHRFVLRKQNRSVCEFLLFCQLRPLQSIQTKVMFSFRLTFAHLIFLIHASQPIHQSIFLFPAPRELPEVDEKCATRRSADRKKFFSGKIPTKPVAVDLFLASRICFRENFFPDNTKTTADSFSRDNDKKKRR